MSLTIYPVGYIVKLMKLKIDPIKSRQMQQRLARVEGQIRGVTKLIETEQDCEKIAQQLCAARKALDKSFFEMVACLLEQGQLSPQEIAKLLARYA